MEVIIEYRARFKYLKESKKQQNKAIKINLICFALEYCTPDYINIPIFCAKHIILEL